MLSRHKGHYMTKALKNRTNCNVMFLDVISCTGIAKNTLDFVNK